MEAARRTVPIRTLIVAGGTAVGLVVVGLIMFRGYEGRPLLLNSDGSVMQRRIECPAARTALTRSFNKADASTPDNVRVCVETGRAKAFLAGMILLIVAAITWGLAHVSRPGRGIEAPAGGTWASALDRHASGRNRSAS